MRVLLLCVLLLLVGSPALAANWYVDDDAAGGGDGSLATPFQTIQAGVTAATSAGDSVLILPGTYVENVAIGAGDNLIISGRSGEPSDVIWQPTGTTPTTTGICLVMTTGTSATVEDLTFQGNNTTGQSGYVVTVDAGTHTMRNVVFDDLNGGFWMYNSSSGGTVVIDQCTFQNPEEANNGSGWAISSWDESLTITNSTFDCRGLVGEAAGMAAAIAHDGDNSAGVIIRGNTFLADQRDQVPAYYTKETVSNVVIENNTFVGGNDGVNDGVIKIGHSVTATEIVERVLIRNNRFSKYGYAAIRSVRPTAATGAQFNKDIVITDNTFVADGTANDDTAVWLDAIIGGYIGGNKFIGGDATAAISLKGCRFVTIAGNDIRDSENGVVIIGNTPFTNSNQYGCNIVGNKFKGSTGDGAIKIDNYDGIGAAAAPNDSLLTVAGNVFDGVSVVAKWVDTSDVTTTFTTLADYQNASTGWLSKSSVDRGNVVGSSDAQADWPFAGGGLNTIGVSGKGLIK